MNSASPNNSPDPQVLLNQIIIDFIKEQKRKRVWRWITRVIVLILLVALYFKIMDLANEDEVEGKKPHAGVIDISGAIFDGDAGNAEYFSKGLAEAYKNSGLKAVILRINSPGGSPVQADYMYNSIQYYQKTYPSIKIYAVCVDLCASAAYYVASAANEIYANESSVVGSIGVLYNGFGFVDVMKKAGITRRLLTAGSNKGFLDPFSPLEPQSQQFMQGILNDVHQEFINKVTSGRGDRLKIDGETFSGLFWTGRQAKERGLIDGFASSGQLIRDQLKLDSVIDYTYKQSLFEQVSKSIGVAIAGSIPQILGLDSRIKAQL